MNRKRKIKPFGLDDLVNYNHEFLFLALEERFATKKELQEFKDQTQVNFDNVLASLDTVVGKLDTLLQERTFDEFLKESNRELWKIAVKAMKKHEILTAKELEKVKMLGIF